LEASLVAVEARLDIVEASWVPVEASLVGIEANLVAIEAMLDIVETRLVSVEANLITNKLSLVTSETALDSMDSRVEILVSSTSDHANNWNSYHWSINTYTTREATGCTTESRCRVSSKARCGNKWDAKLPSLADCGKSQHHTHG